MGYVLGTFEEIADHMTWRVQVLEQMIDKFRDDFNTDPAGAIASLEASASKYYADLDED